MDAIKVSSVTKRYREAEALRGVDLAVGEGTLFGLLGPNGAGKTTLIKALVGALRPNAGTLEVLGLNPLSERGRVRQQIGYMPQSPALYEDLSARDNVRFFGAAHFGEGLHERVEAVLQFTELTERADDRVYTLSGGMKRRVSLAAALVHQPRVLFLDEPTAAVDPYLRARFWDTFRQLARGGTTLFISTHLMDEALLCDQVGILRAGRLIALDTPEGLLQRGRARLAVRTDGRVEEAVIGGQPEDLARALRPYGLRQDVDAVTVRADTLETVLLSMLEQEDKGR
ncbi:MAG: ABC transporter ATP-binding protein [Chloroflexota bacterium]|nr:ABC transporter ATP-binding protein [Chloroflexota bacterium]